MKTNSEKQVEAWTKLEQIAKKIKKIEIEHLAALQRNEWMKQLIK